MANSDADPADYIKPLDVNGLAGRMVVLPAATANSAEILFVYGHHSTLEEWWGLIRYLHRYGTVTAPDLPGFGGMESFYQLGERPSLDRLADYLAAVIKLRYRRKKVVIVTLPLGFVVAARMLQRNPGLVHHVELLAGLSGVTRGDDFVFSARQRRLYRAAGLILSRALPALLLRWACLDPDLARLIHGRMAWAQAQEIPGSHLARQPNAELAMSDGWRQSDLRTQLFAAAELLAFDNCHRRLALPVCQVVIDGNPHLDYHRLEQHLRVAFSDVQIVRARRKYSLPSTVTTTAAAATLIPVELRRMLTRLAAARG